MFTASAKTQRITLYFIIPIALLLLGVVTTQNNIAFYNISPHPYFLVSIILSAYLGLQFSLILSPILAIQFLILLHLQIDYEEVETIFTLEYLSVPLSMIILSSIIGEFKTRSILKTSTLSKENSEAKKLTDNLISKINFLNKESYELKKQLVNKLDTTANIFHTVKKLHILDKDILSQNFKSILQEQSHIEECFLYFYDNEKDVYITQDENEIIELDPKTTKDLLIKKCLHTKQIATIENIYNEQIHIETNDSLIAAPVLLNEHVHCIVSITRIPFLKYTPNNFKLIELYCDWFSKSVEHAQSFSELSSNSIFNSKLNIYTYNYLLERTSEEIDSAKRDKSNFTIISLDLINANKLSEIKLKHYRKIIATVIINNTRKMDCITEAEVSNKFYILVSSSNLTIANKIIAKIAKHMRLFTQNKKTKELFDMKYSTVSYTDQETINDVLNDFKEIDV